MTTKTFVLISLFAAAAHADPPPTAQPYLSVSVGGGYLSASEDMNTITAFTFDLRLAAGIAFTPRLVGYVRFVYDPSVTTPDVSMSGNSTSASGVTITQLSVGPGVSYYWSPSDSVSASLVTAKVSESHDGGGGSTDWGVGVSIGAAK